MLSIKELKQKNSNLDKVKLIDEFKQQLEMEWERAQRLFEDEEFKHYVEYKFRILYLYDEIVELIQDRGMDVSNSFYQLYISRLESSSYIHESAYYNFKDILNLFSDILNKLDRSDDNSLAKKHNFSYKNEIISKPYNMSGTLC
ncbi:hypothetical protein NQ035_10515 [Staphylococcus gallinarum]|uniref:hypothetical protein n=1 Tax=Staphylococcus gallinarum TaxID=1293 RepID=UPI00211BD3B9|nr:hypothetical protein [Staphylococcus gallinarum]MCQ9289303.1 hypothetical protein [Staphylococcus gallinarum]